MIAEQICMYGLAEQYHNRDQLIHITVSPVLVISDLITSTRQPRITFTITLISVFLLNPLMPISNVCGKNSRCCKE